MLLLLGSLIIALVSWKLWSKYKYKFDVYIAEPEVKRKDLYYGYYACFYDQLSETKDHINLFMDSQFEGLDKTIKNILEAKMDTALDIMHQVYVQKGAKLPSIVRQDAEQRLRELFLVLKATGVIQYIKILYPSDEPNMTVDGLEQQSKGVAIVRKVAAEFPELNGVKLACIMAGDREFTGKDLYDYIGYDEYGVGSHMLTSEKFHTLKAELKSFQKIILVPGGAYGQDPTPFVNYAHSDPDVAIVMPFLWYDDPWGNVGAPGIRSGKLKDKYIQAGLNVINN